MWAARRIRNPLGRVDSPWVAVRLWAATCERDWGLSMAFKAVKQAVVSLDSPEALFRDLRQRTIAAPHAHQADVLREYVATAVDRPDVALQLPTGSGKTLVGLLIGEWRRRKLNERVVYLCPTNQLVHQVVEQAQSKYGIEALAFTGKKADYLPASKTEYQNGEKIAVTSYSALFNISPFFENPNLIILDDAHAGDGYIASNWSVRVERFRKEHAPLFTALVGVLERYLSPLEVRRLRGDWKDSWDLTWVDKLPTPVFQAIAPEIAAVLDAHVGQTDLQFPWSMVHQNLSACQLYVGSSEILLRPLIPPTRTHVPFAGAKQRLYMSATLSEGGDLERIAGVDEIFRLRVPPGWDRQGIGRRYFLFPGRSLTLADVEEFQAQAIALAGRALVLVKDNRTEDSFRSWVEKRLGFPVFDAKQIENSKGEFLGQDKAVAVVANRYDGIDFPKDECRLLLVEGLPRATNLQERFLVAKMGAIALLNDRILTRVVQAFGRCTRDATDFAAAAVSGDELVTYLLTKETREFLHPELQAELEFGIEQSKDADIADLMNSLKAFLGQTKDWRAAEGNIVAIREGFTQKRLPGTDDLRKSVAHEVSYQYAMWYKDYPKALECARAALSCLTSDGLRGYRALWLYLAGGAAWLAAREGQRGLEAAAREYFRGARDAAPALHWVNQLLVHTEGSGAGDDQSLLTSVIERLEVRLTDLGMVQDRRFSEEEAFILTNIAEAESKKFEAAHERLGRLLGYEAGNRETTGAPDPWWLADASLCFIFEDNSDAKATSSLGVTKARQVATHPNWVRENIPVSPGASIVPVLVTPVTSADKDALPHLKDVCYWNINDFRAWAAKAVAVVRSLRREFPGSGDLAWRATAAERYRELAVDPIGLEARLRSQVARDVLKRS